MDCELLMSWKIKCKFIVIGKLEMFDILSKDV